MLLTRYCLLKLLFIPLTLILIIGTNTTTAQASIRSLLLIHYSAAGNASMAKRLLRIGADPNFVNKNHSMASIANLNGHRSRLNNKYATALIAAIKNNHFHIAEILLEAGADPSIPDSAGNTALAVAVSHSDNTEFIQKLLDELDKKAELDTPNSRGITPLMQAITNTHVYVTQLLIDEGANIDAENQFGRTPLLLAVEQSSPRIVQMLLDKRVNIGCKKNARECPIIQASRSGNEEILRMLLSAGADIDAKNEKGQTALTEAINNQNIDIAKILLEKGANPNIGKPRPIIQAARIRNKMLIDMLVKRLVNLDATDEENNTALIVALQKGYQDIAYQLLEAEANPNVRNASGEIPLIIALEKEYLDISLPHELLKRGANPNVHNASGEPALIIALLKGHLDVFDELLEQENIDLDAQNISGDTALIVAFREGHLDALYKLLEKGAKPDIPNLAGETVLKMIVYVYSDSQISNFPPGYQIPNLPPHLSHLVQALLDAGASDELNGEGYKLKVTMKCTAPLLPPDLSSTTIASFR